MEEIWKEISEYPTYEVSSLGRVRIKKNKKIRKYGTNKQKVAFVILYSLGVPKCKAVHRLVAETFLGPVPDGHIVKHKDGNTANNELDNLEYVESKRAATIEKCNSTRRTEIKCMETNEVYSSFADACSHIGVSYDTLLKFINSGEQLNGSTYKIVSDD